MDEAHRHTRNSGRNYIPEECVRELKIRHSRFRLRRHSGSPFIYVREMERGQKLGEFSLKPLRWSNCDDIEEARDLCIQGHRKGRWPATQAEKLAAPVK